MYVGFVDGDIDVNATDTALKIFFYSYFLILPLLLDISYINGKEMLELKINVYVYVISSRIVD